jgi:hypothetical protein
VRDTSREPLEVRKGRERERGRVKEIEDEIYE